MNSPASDNTSAKTQSPQSVFIQCAAVPLFALFIYTFSKNVAVSSAIVLIFYGNAVALWGTLKLLRYEARIYDSILIVNLCLVMLGLLFASFSMGGYLSSWSQSDNWHKILFGFFAVYALSQVFFVRKVISLAWGKSLLVTGLALLINVGLCYMSFHFIQ